MLLVLGWVASTVPVAPPEQPGQAAAPWRRTAQGWEQAVWLDGTHTTSRAAVHPLAFAVAELVLAVAVPIALSASHGDDARTHRKRRQMTCRSGKRFRAEGHVAVPPC